MQEIEKPMAIKKGFGLFYPKNPNFEIIAS